MSKSTEKAIEALNQEDTKAKVKQEDQNQDDSVAAENQPPETTKKPKEEKELHKVAKAVPKSDALEPKFPLGEEIELKGFKMEVMKRDGLTVTLRRKDIVK